MFDNIRQDLAAHQGDWGAQGFWALVVYRTHLQEICFQRFEMTLDLLQITIALIDRLPVHDGRRYGGFQHRAAL